MAHRDRRRAPTGGGGRTSPRVTKELRTVLGGVVLVATVRVVDALWHRVMGGPTPVEARAQSDDTAAADPRVVRDRVLYATLLDGALRVARRAGLPKDSGRDLRGTGTDEKSPA